MAILWTIFVRLILAGLVFACAKLKIEGQDLTLSANVIAGGIIAVLMVLVEVHFPKLWAVLKDKFNGNPPAGAAVVLLFFACSALWVGGCGVTSTAATAQDQQIQQVEQVESVYLLIKTGLNLAISEGRISPTNARTIADIEILADAAINAAVASAKAGNLADSQSNLDSVNAQINRLNPYLQSPATQPN